MIVDQQQPHPVILPVLSIRVRRAFHGTDTITCVPWPGLEITARLPPTASARAPIARRPYPPLCVATATGSKPGPSSTIAIRACAPAAREDHLCAAWRTRAVRGCTAWACLRTLVSASWMMRRICNSTSGDSPLFFQVRGHRQIDGQAVSCVKRTR